MYVPFPSGGKVSMEFGGVYEYSILMYSGVLMYYGVFRMYLRARVGKPSDTIKIQHARCEYKRILAHEGSMTLRYLYPTATRYTKQDTSRIQSNTDVSQTSLQDTVKIQAKYSPCMYFACILIVSFTSP